MAYKTIEDTIGNTPLVQLVRLPDDEIRARNNVLLAKLEGNNPAGSVKDRPALSMISKAEARGRIKPGDTLIEATSGNTGIALAMAAAIRGYKMVLIMPEDLSVERRQSMAAYGAEIILTPVKGGMELARDLAEQMQREGKGVILDQFGNPDNPVAHYEATGPEIWRDTEGRITHFVSAMGTTGTIMGTSRYLKEQNPAIEIVGAQPRRRLAYSGHPQMAGSIHADHLRSQPCRPRREREPGRVGNDDAPARGDRRHFRGHFVGRRMRSRDAHRASGRECDDRVHRLRSWRPLSVHGCVSRLSEIGARCAHR